MDGFFFIVITKIYTLYMIQQSNKLAVIMVPFHVLCRIHPRDFRMCFIFLIQEIYKVGGGVLKVHAFYVQWINEFQADVQKYQRECAELREQLQRVTVELETVRAQLSARDETVENLKQDKGAFYQGDEMSLNPSTQIMKHPM